MNSYWHKVLRSRISRRRALTVASALGVGATLLTACDGDNQPQEDEAHPRYGDPGYRRAKFHPEDWPEGDLDRYLRLQNTLGQAPPEAEGARAMIAGTSAPFAVHAGLEVLKHGGNAVDAALTTSLTQVALTAGATISYAGILTAIHYDAKSGRVETLNAGYNTVRGERDPPSIPGPGQPSGRTVLVPGFMAGVEALHTNFGRVPFASLFEPAIWVADHGVPLGPQIEASLAGQGHVVKRLPEGKQIFTKADGFPYRRGELFRQPALAGTLKKVASESAGYMYEGEWARRFVDIVQREGGTMELEDLAAYRALWSDPTRVSFKEYEVTSLGPPSVGGLITLGSLNVAKAADLMRYGHYASSAESLYYLIRIMRSQAAFSQTPVQVRHQSFPSIDPSSESQLTDEVAHQFWTLIREHGGGLPASAPPDSNHSAGVVAVDEEGNVVSILHSINATTPWGSTGIFVDGVSIPDSANFQQQKIAQVGPGRRLYEATNPVLVLKNERPVLASTAIGSGLHQVTIQNLLNVLEFNMDPREAIRQPNTRGPHLGPGTDYRPEAVGSREFPVSLLDEVRERGQPITEVGRYDQLGYWAAVQINEEDPRLVGVASDRLNSLVEGH
jgi:gamma-glutamyltranspeptidase / glutathione hydrolase